ncbi:MAG: DNA-directed RNA polymerase subunit P [Candidatus Marsarchaeota archaeon]|jgi:DNA-directed RNA polymerase subunit RPC12/RpoP|nr:DNA-directed RNA polymerase subunit P [Candidatus Marsarchaeota archaeon]
MVYFCGECRREIDSIEHGISCPYCGSRIVRKRRPGVAREVKTD